MTAGSATPTADYFPKADANGKLAEGWTSRAFYTLTDAATIAVDRANGPKQRVTLTDNREMGAPSNAADGKILLFEIIQDAGGGNTMTWNAAYSFGTDVVSPTLSTDGDAVDYVLFLYSSTTSTWNCLTWARGY